MLVIYAIPTKEDHHIHTYLHNPAVNQLV